MSEPTTKHLIAAVIFFGYAMLSYNRKSVSYIVPYLEDEGLNNQQVGLILSSQNLAYAISKFFGGVMSDQFSSRSLFGLGLIVSGAAALLFSLSDSLYLFTVIWFINGLAQGAGWPAIAKLLKNWFEPTELGLWWSIVSSSANVAGALCPFIAAAFYINFGWRFSIRVAGGLTLIAAIVSLIHLVDKPPPKPSKTKGRMHTKESKTEKIKDERKQAIIDHSRKSPYLILNILLRTKFVWVIGTCYMVVSAIKTILSDWTLVYLMKECKRSSLTASSFLSFFELGGLVGGIGAGFISDRFMRAHEELPEKGHPRMLVAVGFMIMTCTGLHMFLFMVNEHTSSFIIDKLAVVLGASVYGQIAVYGVIATSTVASELSGTSHAIAALAANAGSVIAGLPIALIAEHTSWGFVYLTLILLAVSTLIFMAFTRDISYRVTIIERKAERRTR